jgi:hypothetical protein
LRLLVSSAGKRQRGERAQQQERMDCTERKPIKGSYSAGEITQYCENNRIIGISHSWLQLHAFRLWREPAGAHIYTCRAFLTCAQLRFLRACCYSADSHMRHAALIVMVRSQDLKFFACLRVSIVLSVTSNEHHTFN